MASSGFDLGSLFSAFVGAPVKIKETLPEDIKLPVDQFHYNILVLCDILKDIVTNAIECKIKTDLTPGAIDTYMKLLSGMKTDQKETLILSFINNSKGIWDQIHDKKESSLLAGVKSIFDGSDIPTSQIADITNLITINRTDPATGKSIHLVTPDQMNEIWDNLHGDISVSIRHIYTMRKMKTVESVDSSGVKTQKLESTVFYCPDIKIKPQAAKWKITF
jgi:hypothetical protein